jgi:tetratricopeptide (TPR) repeat protein
MSSLLTAYQRHFRVRRPFVIVLLIAVVLAIYAPPIFGEICDVDDVYMLQSVKNTKTLNVVSLFYPSPSSNEYYRPIIAISFYLDRYLFQLHEGFMKFENVLFHAINALLVYWLALQLLPAEKRRTSLVPLISALFFGINPLTTESVNWISGRTDVLACTFILSSANFLIKFKRGHDYLFLMFSFLFMVLGFLTKEHSISFAAGVFLILFSRDLPANNLSSQNPSRDQAGRSLLFLLVFIFAVIIALVIFVTLKQYAFNPNGKFALTLKIILSNIPYSTFVVLNALAFYLKKIFFPFPLNFAIVEPEPLYDFMGLPILLFCLYLISRRTLIAAIFMTGIFLMTPAFLIAFRQIAWTAYAERYVYLASSFIITASVISGEDILKKKPHYFVYGKYAVVTLLVIAAGGTLERNITWMHNITLYKDTVDKSPNNYLTRIGYGYYLANAGDYHNARIQFGLANQQGASGKTFTNATESIERLFGYLEDADLGLAYVLEKEGRVPEAAEAYERILVRKKGNSVRALDRLIPLYGYMLSQARSGPEIAYPKEKLLLYTGNKYNYKNAEMLYWLGKMLLVRGERESARVILTRAYVKLDDDKYKMITKKMLSRIGKVHAAFILKTVAPSPMA